MKKLHIGCGDIYLDGWVNIDLESETADIRHDLRTHLPFEDNSVDFIYSEHFIEHLSFEEGLQCMQDFYRVLKKGGVIRIATPNLRYLLFKYFFFWKNQDWIKTYKYEWLETPAQMINLCFREWGHQHLYDKQELLRLFHRAGFLDCTKQRRKKSNFSELKNLETRKDSRLVLEAVK